MIASLDVEGATCDRLLLLKEFMLPLTSLYFPVGMFVFVLEIKIFFPKVRSDKWVVGLDDVQMV